MGECKSSSQGMRLYNIKGLILSAQCWSKQMQLLPSKKMKQYNNAIAAILDYKRPSLWHTRKVKCKTSKHLMS